MLHVSQTQCLSLLVLVTTNAIDVTNRPVHWLLLITMMVIEIHVTIHCMLRFPFCILKGH